MKTKMIEHLGTQTIETERLTLRRFKISDAGDLLKCMSDGEVTKYLRVETAKNIDDVKKPLLQWIKKYDEDKSFYRWGVELKKTGELIGLICASAQSERDMIAESGYRFARKNWNKGYATEALKAVINFMIFEVGFNRVEACHSTNNPASGRVMQKAGMKYEGTIRDGYLCGLGFQDSCLYGIIKEDFKSLENS